MLGVILVIFAIHAIVSGDTTVEVGQTVHTRVNPRTGHFESSNSPVGIEEQGAGRKGEEELGR